MGDGRVVTWGDARFGGDSSIVRQELAGGVRHILSTGRALAAVMEDGRMVTWGDSRSGGDSSAVQEQLEINTF